MDFDLTEDQKKLEAMVRDFATAELAPMAAELDAGPRFPTEAFQRLAELRLTGLRLPEEYGGSGLGVSHAAVLLNAVAHSAGVQAAASRQIAAEYS